MVRMNLQEGRAFAEDLARQAAQIALSYTDDIQAERKSDGSPVTQADRAIQKAIVEAVARTYPEHALIGEETIENAPSLPAPADAEYCWVVDPLDGTRNFVRGFPLTATSIALLRGGRPVLGVVREHRTGWQCSAVVGEGATCNGQPAHVSNRPIDRDTLVAVPSGRHQPILPIIRRWVDKYVLRNVGSTSMHMVYVASGAVDGAFCYECKLWDIAAGALIVEEAGGRCTDLQGQPIFPLDVAVYTNQDLPFLAASGDIFDELLSELSVIG